MYNRYIPQSDGSYRRNRVEDRTQPERQHTPPPPPESPSPIPGDSREPQPQQTCPAVPSKAPPCRQNTGAGDFLRRLLPKNLDTGDLLVIILLLLMAGDCAEDQNTALLTLALYLFL